ncbi:Ribonuclease HII [Microbacterium oleivorans]|uniref:ribonuclease HII n=1 Tax=Microbacterium oleivorans TaxID=273677 RepID=UPI000976960C|nr:ribonuclease HII [Microbacterium oleivorans]AZS43948.1 Ribonuclease HII [Microbacterium oleivorans]
MAVVAPTLTLERRLLREHALVIACDEVGRGALAGPVAVGAVAADAAFSRRRIPQGLRDSKLIVEPRRADVAERARAWVPAHAVGWATAAEVDHVGIMRALGVAAVRAIQDLGRQGVDVQDALVILDGNYDYISPVAAIGRGVQPIIKADRDCASASAASVIAKVARDDHMGELDGAAPVYGWCRNKGYASAEHRAAIEHHGLSAHHRASWAIAAAPTLF